MTRIAIITGASSGIGEATAHRFIANGWFVIGISRRRCSLPKVHSLQVDLDKTDFEKELKPMLLPLISSLAASGQARISLIHNAAQLCRDSSLSINPLAMRAVLQLNLVAAAILNAIIAPWLGNESSILYVGSTLSEKAVPNTASYIVSKHAVLGMMRATCQDLLGKPVHTACICPGFVDTPMINIGANEEKLAELAAMTTYNRLAQPEEIAELLYFAANSPYLNGSTVHANYGQIER